jgi:hypothetical protein
MTAERDAEFTRLEALQRRVQAEITDFRAGDRVDRDTLHDRTLARIEERDATS